MILNLDKFQAIVLQRWNETKSTNTLNIENITTSITKSVELLLGVTIDDKLNFEEYVSALCKKASLQLNAISRLQIYMGKKEREPITNIFIYSNFNYCSLVWHFCSCKPSNKIEQRQKRCFRTILNGYKSDYKTLLENSSRATINPLSTISSRRDALINFFWFSLSLLKINNSCNFRFSEHFSQFLEFFGTVQYLKP